MGRRLDVHEPGATISICRRAHIRDHYPMGERHLGCDSRTALLYERLRTIRHATHARFHAFLVLSNGVWCHEGSPRDGLYVDSFVVNRKRLRCLVLMGVSYFFRRATNLTSRAKARSIQRAAGFVGLRTGL